jgi:quinoprotein dehydrogenase-associated probable ABC transporter substrate-binding protein
MTVTVRIFLTILTSLVATATIAEDKFRVCADPLHPPYSQKDTSGFENKIAELFADKLGQTVEYYWFSQRIGFIRNTLRAKIADSEQYKCDVVMGVPANYELVVTSQPYYHSTYVMLIAKGRGFDEITSPEQLAKVDGERLDKMRIAMFDRGPGTTWLQQNGLLEQGIPYQTMTGDSENNVAMLIDKDLRAKKIDMVILWGPMAGYVISNAPENSYIAMPMQSKPGLKHDFSIAMGVRFGDHKRKDQLNQLITENADAINKIITEYNIPLLPIPEQKPEQDDD